MPYTEIDRKGRFRVRPMKLTLRQADTGSVNISVLAQILEMWNPEKKAWDSWEEYAPYEVRGNINLVKKDGTINERAIADTVKCLGWNGDLTQFDDQTWVPSNFQFDVKQEEYNGKTIYKGSWMYPYDSDPNRGAMGQEKLGELNMQYGANFRAIASNLAANSTKPGGAPKAAPPPPPKAAPPPKDVGSPPF